MARLSDSITYGNHAITGNADVGGTLTVNGVEFSPVSLTGGTNVSVSGTYPNFTISSTDTNTTYSAGTGLNLTGTSFSLNMGSTFNGTYPLVVNVSGQLYQHADVTYTGTSGILTAPNFSGNGSGLTSLNASNLGSGTVSTARLPASALIGDTTYSAGTGISLSGTTFSLTGDSFTAANYLRSNASDTATGLITFNQGIGVRREDNVYVTPTSFTQAVDFKFTQEGQLNSPPGSGSWAQLMTFQGWTAHNAAYPSYQMVFRNGAVGVRQSTSDTVWGGWRQLAETNGTYSGLRAQATTKADVGLSNVSNVASNTGNVANTNAQRDSSGDIRCRLLRPEYTSLNTGANVNYFWTSRATGTGDNYLRPTTLAEVKNVILGGDGVSSNYVSSVSDDVVDGKLTFNDHLFINKGIHGGYGTNGTGNSWGAPIWSRSASSGDYGLSTPGAGFDPGSYQLSWLMTTNADSNSNVGEGVYLFSGGYRGGIGAAGIDTLGTITASSSITAGGNVTAYSDIRLKANVEVIPEAISKVKQISGYTFDRIDRECDRQTGVIAQEVMKVLPEAVSGGPTEEDPDAPYSVAYGNIVGLLIEAIKEQQNQIDELKRRID